MKIRAAGIFVLIVLVCGAAFSAIWYWRSQEPSTQSGYGAALELCRSYPNNSTQHLAPTSRTFINLPKTLYPDDISGFFKTATGTATVGVVTNGGEPGKALKATQYCSSTYFEFGGAGEIDLEVPAAAPTIPTYSVRFIVGA